ncbi:MAG: type II secretion system protein GspK [Gammaproteobacteria bacterium]
MWGEDWYRGAMFPLPDGIGLIEGKLHDLQGRFNINSLADPDAKRQALFAGVFASMINDLLTSNPDAFPEGTTANMLKERVIDWLDTDQENTGFDGREDDDYFRKERPYRTANHVITDASELLLIDGFTPQALALLEDKISFLPYSAKIICLLQTRIC